MQRIEVSDDELLKRLGEFVQKEHEGTVGVVLHLSELEERRLHYAFGYSSLYSYVVIELGYSESAAMRRIVAARLIRRFPEVQTLLQKRLLNLTTMALIAPVMNEENKVELLKRVTGQSKRRVEEILCEYRSPEQSDCEERISPYLLALKDKMTAEKFEMMSKRKFKNYLLHGGTVLERRFRIQFGASAEFVEKVERAKELLSGKYPKGASLEAVFDLLLDDYIQRNCPREKEKRAMLRRCDQKGEGSATVNHDPAESSDNRSRYIPAAVRQEVLRRDGYKCSFKTVDGTKCGSTWDLELDHFPIPFSLGGSSTPENLRTVCRCHNQYNAEQKFGVEFMNRCKAA